MHGGTLLLRYNVVMITTKNIRWLSGVWVTAITLLSISMPVSASSLRTLQQVTPFSEVLGGAELALAPMQSRAGNMSADGRFVVFWSANGSVVANDTNQASDIFIYDRTTAQTQRLLLGANHTQANNDVENATISANGRYIAFTTRATNTVLGAQCVPSYGCAFTALLDRQTGSMKLVNRSSSGQLLPISNEYRPLARLLPAMVSADGSQVVFGALAVDNTADLYVRDMHTGSVKQVNIDRAGRPAAVDAADVTVSADGHYVAFSTVTALTPHDTNGGRDVYIRNVSQAQTMLVSHALHSIRAGNNISDSPVISADGSTVVYRSTATDLTATHDPHAPSNIFAYTIAAGQTRQISAAMGGGQTNGNSFSPSISANGSFVTFVSEATNMSRQPDTSEADVFLYYQRAGIIRKIPRSLRQGITSLVMGSPAISDNGRALSYVLYTQISIDPAQNTRNLYMSYDPVVDIPFYDPNDYIDLL